MSEPCPHERDVPYVPAALVADLERVIARQLAELYTLRDKVARVERLVVDLDGKADSIVGMSLGDRWRRSTLHGLADTLRRVLEGP